MSSTKLGLALSGGGYRATFFHLGVVRCLRDYGRLRDVDVITSVSGGSILAAHLVLNWGKYNGTEAEFDEAAGELRKLSESDFRNREARLIGWRSLFGRYCGNTSHGAQKIYADELFGNRTLESLGGTEANPSPKLFILSTDLNDPTSTVSFSSDGVRFHGQAETEHLSATASSIATAVTASAAFPPFFIPINLDTAETGANEAQLPHQPLFLTDGGVRDNSGAKILREVASHCDKLIVSDASRALDLDRKTDYSSSRAKTLLRVIDILQTRVADEVFASQQKQSITVEAQEDVDQNEEETVIAPPEQWIRISDRLDPKTCSVELQNDISAIRTDLDRFESEEIVSLYHFGCAQADQADLRAKKNAPKDRLKPFSDDFSNSIPTRLLNSREVSVKLFGRDMATVLNGAVLAGLALVLLMLGLHLYGVTADYLLRFASNDIGYAVVVEDDSQYDLRPLDGGPSEDKRLLGPTVQTRTLKLRKVDDYLKTIRLRMSSSVQMEAKCLTHRHVVVDVSEPSVSGEHTFKTKLDIVIDVSDHAPDEEFQVIVVGVNTGGFSGTSGDFAASRSSPGKTDKKIIRILLPKSRVVKYSSADGFGVSTDYAKEAKSGEPKQEKKPYEGPVPVVYANGKAIEWTIPAEKLLPSHAYYLNWEWDESSDEILTSLPTAQGSTASNEWLQEVEANRLHQFDFHDRKSPHDNWKDAWAAANSGLFEAMGKSQKDKVNCVYAGGGVGKGLFINVAKKKLGENSFAVVKFDRNVTDRLKTLADASLEVNVTLKDYLTVAGFDNPFRLPAPTLDQFRALRKAAPNLGSSLIVDGLDEIHPDSSRRILSLFFEELESPPAMPVFVFARPETFWFYFSKNEASQPKAVFHYLTPPQDFYRDSATQLLADLQEYKATDTSSAFLDLFQELIEKSDAIRASVGITSLRNFVLETLSSDPKWKQLSPGLTDSQVHEIENDFKTKAYGAVLDYNRISHARPSPDGDASQVRLYEAILGSVALKYNSPDVLDEKGWFTPSTGNTLQMMDPTTSQLIEIDVSAFLRFSGFVEVDPTYIKSPRFRFTPAWMHRYLADRNFND